MTTDLNTLTKTDLNAKLAKPLGASALKKTSKDDLIARVVAEAEVITEATTKDRFSDNFTGMMPKPAATTKPAGSEDRVITEPAADLKNVRPTTEGSKRHLLAQALERGATLDHLMEVTGWNRSTTQSALRWDMGQMGLGVERKGDKYFLILPAGVKRIPVRDRTVSRADALVAACR